MNIFLDMDGVLTDFLGEALTRCNDALGEDYSVEDYVNYGKFSIPLFYRIPEKNFWSIISMPDDFFAVLNATSYAFKLYEELSKIGDVTIVTAPSLNISCIPQKITWLKKYLNIPVTEMVFTNKKHLLAGNGILIDDSTTNVDQFTLNGGKAILVPSDWNTKNVTFEMVWKIIKNSI